MLTTLKVFLDALEEGVLFLDGDRRVVQMNQSAARLVGQSPQIATEEMLCPTMFRGNECARECELRGSCSLGRGSNEPRKVQDVRLKRSDGGTMTLRMWALLLPPNDEQLHCAIVLRDRTHEAALEEEIRERWKLGALVGRHPSMQSLYAEILRCAASEANVLVTGESGVGKELVARAIHDNSARASGPFVGLHCAALPENLLESELFGHAKGAFSGAAGARIGRFEAAHGGTLLLDEVGEISPGMQTKLLRVLQEREIVRLGENHSREIDVRVIAATHRDLQTMLEQGQFREDLYYRLRVLPIPVPALRERIDDLPVLAGKLLDELSRRYKRPRVQLHADALLLLERYSWPGNVRQLANVLEYALVHCEGPTITAAHLSPEVHSSRPAQAGARPLVSYYRAAGSEQEEKETIRRVLEEVGGNRTEAARRLKMSRTTLWKHLKVL